MENRNNEANCGHSAELMSYLYGELDREESRVFKTHIDTCRSCAAESVEFAGLRESIAEMRAEFQGLPTPPIDIPYRAREVGSEPISIFESIRAFLAGFRAFSVGAAAVFLLAFGVGLYFLTADRGSDLAGGNQNRKNAIASPTVEPTASRTPETVKSETVNPNAPTTPAPVKAADKRVTPEPKPKPETRRTAPNSNKKPKQSAPIFDEGEEEDDTLRLADLFGDIGTE